MSLNMRYGGSAMAEESISINLEDLREIMDGLETPTSGERRKNNLTKDDVLVIAKIIQAVSGQSCSKGFEDQEVNAIKRIVSSLGDEELAVIKRITQVINRGSMAVGWLLVSTIISGLVALLVLGIKHGIYEIATKGVK